MFEDAAKGQIMWLEIVIIAITFLLVWDYLRKKRKNDMLHYMRGPRALPLIGSALIFRGQNQEEIMNLLVKQRLQYGASFRIWVLHRVAVFSCDPNDIAPILASTKFITKNSMYELLRGWLGTGLLMSTGHKWHQHRKIISPTFHFKILEQFVEIFEQQSEIMVQLLYGRADGKTAVDIFPMICLTTLDIIAETAMGTKVHAQMNPDFPYVQATRNITDITCKRFINIWTRVGWIFRLISPGAAKRLRTSIETTHDFTKKIIMEHRIALQQSITERRDSSLGQQETLDENIGLKPRMALLDVLLQSTIDGQPLSDEDIREEVDTFMFAGHDTTTSGISFCLYLISRHAEVQQKLYEEICEVLGTDKDRPVTMRDLNSLKYLECVIKEALRMYPPVPIIGRYIDEDVVINGKPIPADCSFTIGLYILLRDPAYFPDPDTFKPERFLHEAEKMHPFAYIPFSAGPRNCIGQKFAILEIKSIISKVLRHFELLPLGPAVRPMVNLVLRSASGAHFGLQPRL